VKLPDTLEGEFGVKASTRGTDLMKKQRNPGGEDSGKNHADGHAVTSNIWLIKKLIKKYKNPFKGCQAFLKMS